MPDSFKYSIKRKALLASVYRRSIHFREVSGAYLFFYFKVYVILILTDFKKIH